jgi:tripartite-type tricarboxylate transporter receptor subunit TctC
MRNRLLHALGIVVAAMGGIAVTGGPVSAQSWPQGKTIQLVNPLTAGSATDIITRIVFEQVDKQMGSTSVVESRPGGGGTVAAASVARAAPDGFTVLIASSAYTITAVTFQNLPYDPIKDFAPVTTMASQANVLVASPAKGWKTVQDLVAAAKARPGQLNYGTVGPASAAHFNAERLRLAAGFEAQPVPFRGPLEGLTEVMAGRVDYHFVPLLPALPLIREGKVVPLAVSSPKRAAALPDVPTTIEAGYPNSEYTFWFGLLFPAKTPPAIVERLNQEVRKALEVPEVKQRIERISAEPMPSSPEEFGALMRQELEDNAKIVKATGLKVN